MIELYLNPMFWFKSKTEKKRKIINRTLSGEARDRAILEIETTDPLEITLGNLSIDHKYGKINDYEFEIKKAELGSDDENELAEITAVIDLEFGKITDVEYRHRLADIKGEPFVEVIEIDYDEKNPGAGYFSLDFNEHFVEYLAQNGYSGTEPEEIVDSWFNDICKNIVLSELENEDGTAKSFLSDSKEGKLIQRTRVDQNFSEYT